MEIVINNKEVRKINKFLREKVGFKPINTNTCSGEFRVLKIVYTQPYLFINRVNIKIHIEFKGKLIRGYYGDIVLNDLKWSTAREKNRKTKWCINSDVIIRFITPFLLVDNNLSHRAELAPIKWIE